MDAAGRQVKITTVAALNSTAATTTITTAITTNPLLPMLGGCPGVLKNMAHFLDVPLGSEYHRTQELLVLLQSAAWQWPWEGELSESDGDPGDLYG